MGAGKAEPFDEVERKGWFEVKSPKAACYPFGEPIAGAAMSKAWAPRGLQQTDTQYRPLRRAPILALLLQQDISALGKYLGTWFARLDHGSESVIDGHHRVRRILSLQAPG